MSNKTLEQYEEEYFNYDQSYERVNMILSKLNRKDAHSILVEDELDWEIKQGESPEMYQELLVFDKIQTYEERRAYIYWARHYLGIVSATLLIEYWSPDKNNGLDSWALAESFDELKHKPFKTFLDDKLKTIQEENRYEVY